MPRVSPPRLTVSPMASPVFWSSSWTLLSPELVSQTLSWSTTSWIGSVPTGTVRGVPPPGSSRVTVPSSWLATQTAPRPARIPSGPSPTLTVSWILPPVLTLLTVSSSELVTQTAPSPTATLSGLVPTFVVPATRRLSGSIRVRVPLFLFAAQTEPAPTSIPSTPEPTSIGDSALGSSGLLLLSSLELFFAVLSLPLSSEPPVSRTAAIPITATRTSTPATMGAARRRRGRGWVGVETGPGGGCAGGGAGRGVAGRRPGGGLAGGGLAG